MYVAGGDGCLRVHVNTPHFDAAPRNVLMCFDDQFLNNILKYLASRYLMILSRILSTAIHMLPDARKVTLLAFGSRDASEEGGLQPARASR
mgnify:CR=1 FL=1